MVVMCWRIVRFEFKYLKEAKSSISEAKLLYNNAIIVLYFILQLKQKFRS